MKRKPNPQIASALRRWAFRIGAFVALVGLLATCGWWLKVQQLTAFVPDRLPMEPNSALSFALCGLSTMLLVQHRHSWWRLLFGRAFAASVLMLSLWTLWVYAAGVAAGVDPFVLAGGGAGITAAGRMAPTAAVSFGFLATALILLDLRVTFPVQPSQLCALSAFATSAVTVFSWTYALDALHRVGTFFQMPMETAIVCCVLATAVLFARPETGVTEVLTSDYYGGVTARKLMPLVFGYPVLIGWARALLEWAGMRETPQALAAFFVLLSAPMPLIVWWICRSLDDADSARSEAEERVTQLNEDLKHQVEQLEVARDAAMEASRMKSQFVANISHELRTPLGGVIGMNELLLESELTADQAKLATMALESGRHLLGVINELLDFSSLDSGKVKLTSIDVAPAQIIRECVDLLQGDATRKGLTVRVAIEEKLPAHLIGDPLRLRAVVLNLLGNAIKFTDSGGIVVRCALESRDDSVVKMRFSVSDTGVGIAESERDRLFQPFVQLDGSTTRRKGGTGLGLSICKRVVELMGGEIGLDSIEGQGSTFWFVVPFRRAGSTGGSAPTESAGGAEERPAAGGDLDFRIVVSDGDNVTRRD